MMIKRYDLVFSPYFEGGGIGEKENGKYALYSDYEKLQARWIDIAYARLGGVRDSMSAQEVITVQNFLEEARKALED